MLGCLVGLTLWMLSTVFHNSPMFGSACKAARASLHLYLYTGKPDIAICFYFYLPSAALRFEGATSLVHPPRPSVLRCFEPVLLPCPSLPRPLSDAFSASVALKNKLLRYVI